MFFLKKSDLPHFFTPEKHIIGIIRIFHFQTKNNNGIFHIFNQIKVSRVGKL